MNRILTCFLLAVHFFTNAIQAAESSITYQPTDENVQARAWFQDSKFGLFIHWGIYSLLGKGEWVMQKAPMTCTAYEEMAKQFDPQDFDPVALVTLAKEAGMRYITITARHHDGFSLWATQQNQWNIVEATPYRKDLLKALSEECHRQDMKLFFYYSQLDWHHPDYFPRGQTGQFSGRKKAGDFNRYLDFMNAQLTELLTGYGEVAGIWFDGMWDKPSADWQLRRTYDLIHALQPAALVGSNHHLTPFEGEDFQMFEKDLPGKNSSGWNAHSVIGSLPLETCETINHSWGYDRDDKQYKSMQQLIHYLVKAAGNNANFLLNIGPRSDGTVQPEFLAILKEMGIWMKKHGDAIYGTRAGPIPPSDWGVSTQKGSYVYLHILDPRSEIVIPKIGIIQSATLWPEGKEVRIEEGTGDYRICVPMDGYDPIDTIIALHME